MATRSAVAHAVFDLSHYVRTSRGRLAADTGCGGMAADGISYRPDFSRASDALSSREFARVLVLARDEIVGLDGAEVRLVSPPSPIVPAGVYTFGSGPQAYRSRKRSVGVDHTMVERKPCRSGQPRPRHGRAGCRHGVAVAPRAYETAVDRGLDLVREYLLGRRTRGAS